MTSSLSPTWYDVLGVSHDATPNEIKAAWRNATDKFEPGSGSGQFRMFNEAADVLLDPVSRVSYDNSLADPSTQADQGVAPAIATPAAKPEPAHEPEVTADESRSRRRLRRPRSAAASSERAVGSEPASPKAVVLTALLTLLTVAALFTAGLLGLRMRTDAQISVARDEVPAAAERAVKAVFSYDYRTLPADRKRAEGFLTGAYEKEYRKTATLLERQADGAPGLAVQSKTVVTSEPLGSAVIGAESDAVQVLVYVNLTSRKADRAPQIFQNRVRLHMRKIEGRWLISKVDTY